jgi:cysteine desulfurase
VRGVTVESPAADLPDPAPRPPAGYLDAVAGQPMLPAARAAWLAAADQGWSDPVRLHHEGRRAGMLLDAARASIAASLGLPAAELYLTSSGPTALDIAVRGLIAGAGTRRVVASAVESMAVLSQVAPHADPLDLVPVDAHGRVDAAAFAEALDRPAALACLQAANGEVGARQPLEPVLERARAVSVPLLVHAVQVIGRGPAPTAWDVLASSARDWGGPAGVGVLAVRSTLAWRPDANERGWVGGFPDIPGAVAAATALEYLSGAVEVEAERAFSLTARLRAALPGCDPSITVAGPEEDRLPHIVTFTCTGVSGEALVHELGRRGLSVASGSACTADTTMASQVLAAMGLRPDASIRLSLPFGCPTSTVETFLAELPEALAAVRA